MALVSRNLVGCPFFCWDQFNEILFFQEPCGLFRICAGASLLTGVALIAKPPFLFGSADTTYDFLGKICDYLFDVRLLMEKY